VTKIAPVIVLPEREESIPPTECTKYQSLSYKSEANVTVIVEPETIPEPAAFRTGPVRETVTESCTWSILSPSG